MRIIDLKNSKQKQSLWVIKKITQDATASLVVTTVKTFPFELGASFICDSIFFDVKILLIARLTLLFSRLLESHLYYFKLSFNGL